MRQSVEVQDRRQAGLRAGCKNSNRHSTRETNTLISSLPVCFSAFCLYLETGLRAKGLCCRHPVFLGLMGRIDYSAPVNRICTCPEKPRRVSRGRNVGRNV
ncbi:hypothetical protein ANTRET_LOCUS2719 [Anthophora retusa]